MPDEKTQKLIDRVLNFEPKEFEFEVNGSRRSLTLMALPPQFPLQLREDLPERQVTEWSERPQPVDVAPFTIYPIRIDNRDYTILVPYPDENLNPEAPFPHKKNEPLPPNVFLIPECVHLFGAGEFPSYITLVKDGTYKLPVQEKLTICNPRKVLEDAKVKTASFKTGIIVIAPPSTKDCEQVQADIEVITKAFTGNEMSEVNYHRYDTGCHSFHTDTASRTPKLRSEDVTLIAGPHKIRLIDKVKSYDLQKSEWSSGGRAVEGFVSYMFKVCVEGREETCYAFVLAKEFDKDSKPIFSGTPIVRVESGCMTGVILGDVSCSCQVDFFETLSIINDKRNGEGIIIYLPDQEGRGRLLPTKCKLVLAQEFSGINNVEIEASNFPDFDPRTYDTALLVLKLLTDKKHIRLITNNKDKLEAFRLAGFELTKRDVIKFKRLNSSFFAEWTLRTKNALVRKRLLRDN